MISVLNGSPLLCFILKAVQAEALYVTITLTDVLNYFSWIYVSALAFVTSHIKHGLFLQLEIVTRE